MSIDPDFLTNGVTGAPATWDDECCEVVLASGTASYAESDVLATPPDVAYARFEFILGSDALADNEERMVFELAAAGNIDLIRTFVRQISGGALRWRYRVVESGGSSSIYTASTGPAQDTLYRIEFKWDTLDSLWEIRLDNTTQFNGGLSGGSAAAKADQVVIGSWETGAGGLTYYLDNIAVAADDWIGGEGGAPITFDVARLSPANRVAIVSM